MSQTKREKLDQLRRCLDSEADAYYPLTTKQIAARCGIALLVLLVAVCVAIAVWGLQYVGGDAGGG